MNIVITFAEKDRDVVDQLAKHFVNLNNVSVVRNSTLQATPAHCLVCPSNSYGLLDDRYGKSIDVLFNDISKVIRNRIDTFYLGEQPVGTCMLIPTGDQKYPYVAHLPVMHIQDSDVSDTHNAYYAFRALLVAIINHNRTSPQQITSILSPSLCVNAGMTPKEAARQMRLAYSFIETNMPCSYDTQTITKELL